MSSNQNNQNNQNNRDNRDNGYPLEEILDNLTKSGVLVEKENKANLVTATAPTKPSYEIQQTIESFWKKHNNKNELESFRYGMILGSMSNTKNSKVFFGEILSCMETSIKEHIRKSKQKNIKEIQTIFAMQTQLFSLLEEIFESKDHPLHYEDMLSLFTGFLVSKYNKHKTLNEEE